MRFTMLRAWLGAIPAHGAFVAAHAPRGLFLAAGASGEIPHDLVFNIVNFLILVIVLAYVLRKPAASFFSNRSGAIRRELEQARRAIEESKAKLAEAADKAAHLEQEIQNLRAAARQEMEREGERLRQEAAQEAAKIQQLAQARVAAALRAAQAELRTYAAAQVVAKAQEALRRRLDDEGQHRLLRDFLTELRTKASPN